jgi:polyferredoxin
MLLELFTKDCQVGPTCQKNVIRWLTLRRFLSLESFESHPPRMSRRWWGIYILTLLLRFSCGINELVPGFISDLSDRWALSLAPFFFPFSYVLLSIFDNYFHLLSCLSLRYFKGKQRATHQNGSRKL